MRFSHFFIDRPIFAAVLSIVTVVLGAIAYLSLPASQYPDVVPPTIVVRASYPGAPPEVIAATVATPIEQEVNGVEDMLYMSSQSTPDGQMTLTITFRLGADLDKAQVLVQNRVAIAEPRLPEEVRRLGITTAKTSPDLLMVVHMLSPDQRFDQLYIGNYALIQIRDVLARIDGVGDVSLFGLREYSMRVWLDPERLASRSLTTGDVVQALREQNIQVASGVIGQPPGPSGVAFQLPVNTLGRLLDPEQFEAVVVKTGGDGRLTRVRDVARIELGARDYAVNSYLDNQPAVAMVVFQRPGSNALATAEAVERTMHELSEGFPEGLEHRIVYNPTVFVRESIDAVIDTLYEAIGLVVLVVLIFLQSWRASVIPLLAIPVSLIGTFAAMAAFGFSLNMLSLFGLVLAIGIVVDDAIVVVENVERHMAAGLPPREAARKAMDEVTGAVIAIAFGLTAVFVPTAFLGGITGQFYRQFALTIAVSTLLSALNSLTLSPALCALLLQPHGVRKDWFGRLWDRVLGRFFAAFNRGFDRLSGTYGQAVGWWLRRSALGLAVYLLLVGLAGLGFWSVPTGFIPTQDKGYLIVAIQLPDGASLARTDAVVRRASDIILGTPGVQYAVAFAGFSGATRSNAANAGAIFVGPKPFEERVAHGPSAGELLATLQGRLSAIQEADIFVIPPPAVQGLGTSGGFTLLVQDRAGRGLHALQEATDAYVDAARREPTVAGVFSTFRASAPQLYADVDRVKAQKLNVPLGNVFDTLQVYLGSVYVNDFNLFGRTFQVRTQAEGDYRAEPADIARLKTRNLAGGMVPMGSLVDVQWRSGPDRVVRYNMFPAAEVIGNAAPGESQGTALATMERLAADLPPGMAIEWTDLAYQAKLAGNTALFIFPLCVLFVFLVHSAEYESWILPLAIILIAPLCLPFALGGVWLRGIDNNLITQVGFVVLIGLAAKNAVLIVEFAKQQEDEGKDRFAAALEACRLRLRPILMTSFAFILGVLPLARATGPGAEMRQALGTAVLTGMLGVTAFGLFLTPVFYVVLRGLVARWRPPAAALVALVAATALAGSGCMLAGRDYRRPEYPAPDAFANAGAADGPFTVETAWWEGFGDAALADLVARATGANHDLAIAAARVREARALRVETMLDLAPTITAEGGYTRSRTSEDRLLGGAGLPGGAGEIDRDQELFDAGFDATWELDLFGRVRRAVEARTADLESAEDAFRDVLVTLQAELARNYFELRGAQRRLAVARGNAENQQATLALTLALLEGGRGTEFDTSRARAQLTATLATIPPLEAAVKRALHRLSVLSGEPPAALEAELAPPVPLPTLPALAAVGRPEDLLRRRPDIRAAERALAAATALRGVAVADLFPRVTFVGSVALEADSFSALGASGSETFSFGPRIFWPALDLGRVRARIEAADSRTAAALARYERTVLVALEDTENALVDFDREQQRRDHLRVSAEASGRAAQLARERYQFGISDFLTVLDAERTVLEAEDRLAESETRAATALVGVYKALGGGWGAVPRATPAAVAGAIPGT
jgi:multidrug efflux pump